MAEGSDQGAGGGRSTRRLGAGTEPAASAGAGTHQAGPTAERSFRFTLGLERLGLVALQTPALTLGLIVIATFVAILGVSRLTVDDSLTELFRTDTEEFRRYEEVDRRFPSSEYDVLVVVEGDGLLTRKGLKAYSTALIEMQLADGIGGVVSMFSARAPLDETGYAAPIVPDVLPKDDAAFAQVIARLKANEIVKGKFLSDDGRLGMIVLSLDRDATADGGSDPVIAAIETALGTAFADSGLTYRLTGPPVMQREIRNAVQRDRIIYNGLGLLLGIVVAFIFFRRISLTILAVLGPSIAILWTLGAVGGLDFRLNLFINVLTPLILVSGFSDSMHLVMAMRREIVAGVDRVTAARNAVRDVAPACLLTAMNAAIALMSFALAESALVRTFGQAAILAVTISYLAVAVVVPTVAVFLIRDEGDGTVSQSRKTEANDEGGAIAFVGRLTEALVDRVSDAPRQVLGVGLIVVALCAAAYASLEPRYRLADQVPDKEQALAASASLDQKLTGANPVHVMISWTGDRALYSEQTLAIIGDVHRVLERVAGLGNVWSLESLRDWLEKSGRADPETVGAFVGKLPDNLVRRFVAKEENAVLVTGRLPDVDASEILPVVERINAALADVRTANPDVVIAVTGLSAIAARNSAKLIGELNLGLVGDMFIIFIFLGVALRSVLAGVASILPSLFPIFATGTLIWLGGGGLQFASIIAITVAFALAIDSTIHFLNRYHLEEDRFAASGQPIDTRDVLRATIHHIGPAVVLTTLVLALGLGVTVLSDLPSLRLFGALSAVCLFASLAAQLLILPAVIAVYRAYWPRVVTMDAVPATGDVGPKD
ncbi:MAG: MMPL family transporter [Pseudomonadota bacterium]